MSDAPPASKAAKPEPEQPAAGGAPEHVEGIERSKRLKREHRLTGVLGAAEDAVYALAALMLVAASLVALLSAATALLNGLVSRQPPVESALAVLDQLLVVLIFLELFYTVRLSIREHGLAVEPFLAVALIATVRRVLVLMAEEHQALDGSAEQFQRVLLELGLLAIVILVLVFALLLLRRTNTPREGTAETGR